MTARVVFKGVVCMDAICPKNVEMSTFTSKQFYPSRLEGRVGVASKLEHPMEAVRANVTPDVAERLRVLREYITPGTSLRQFCLKYNFGYTNWHNYEKGYNVPSEVAMRIVDLVPGLTLDWLYRGRFDGMAFDLVSALRRAEATLAARRS